jgi:hypothetical protein
MTNFPKTLTYLTATTKEERQFCIDRIDAKRAKKVTPAQRRALAALRPRGSYAAQSHRFSSETAQAPSFYAKGEPGMGSKPVECKSSSSTLWALVDQGLLSDRLSDRCGLGMGCKRWSITPKGRRIADLIAAAE